MFHIPFGADLFVDALVVGLDGGLEVGIVQGEDFYLVNHNINKPVLEFEIFEGVVPDDLIVETFHDFIDSVQIEPHKLDVKLDRDVSVAIYWIFHNDGMETAVEVINLVIAQVERFAVVTQTFGRVVQRNKTSSQIVILPVGQSCLGYDDCYVPAIVQDAYGLGFTIAMIGSFQYPMYFLSHRILDRYRPSRGYRGVSLFNQKAAHRIVQIQFDGGLWIDIQERG